jgi:O-antigen/teichoic acid export membrane protein
MDIFAYITLFESFSRLGALYLIKAIDGDNLILYGISLLVIQVIITIAYVAFCKRNFEECVHFVYFDKTLFKEMTSFVGYNIYGCFAFAVCQQGINVLLNNFFGPAVNAARAIATQVYSAVYKFSDNILMSVKPPMIKLYSQNSIEAMVDMASRTTKYCLFINTLIALPILFNIDFILTVWLKTVPDFANAFVIIVMIESYFNIMCQTITILANATGDLKRNQGYGRTFTLFSVPLAYVLLLLWQNPIVPIICALLGTIGYFLIDLYDVHIQLNVNATEFAIRTIFPVVILNAILVFGLYIIQIYLPAGWYRLLIVFVVDIFLGSALIYLFFLKEIEREYIKSLIRKFIR